MLERASKPDERVARLGRNARGVRPARLVVLVGAVLAVLSSPALGQPWREGFESARPSWRAAGGDADCRIAHQQRVRGGAHSGEAAERIVAENRGGSRSWVSHDVGSPRVIPDLVMTVWVKANRTGPQLFARVVLPRTTDPRSGQPVTTLVAGTTYAQPGRWQQLRLDQIPNLVEHQVRLLRMQIGAHVDPREAYVDQILLNVHGGPGTTDVLIDDLELTGYVGPPNVGPPNVGVSAAGANTPGRATPGPWVADGPPRANGLASGLPPSSNTNQGWVPADPQPPLGNNAISNDRPNRLRRVELRGSVLQVDNQPVFIRAIRHQGESLAKLKELGFNTVWTTGPATEALLREARQHDLFLVCSPPQYVFERPADAGPMAGPTPVISADYEPVVAWDLGWGLLEEELPVLRERAAQTRAADLQKGRPRICHAEVNLRGFSRHVDLLIVGRTPLATSIELNDYSTWIRERPRLARPGTVVWSTVQTEAPQALMDQWLVAGREFAPPPEVTCEQIRLAAYGAIVAGSRGLLFDSRGSLEATDRATRARAAALRQLNLELDLIRPWVAAGSLVDTVTVKGQPELAGAVFWYNRSRLLVPMWVGPGAQFVPGQSAGNAVSFTVPGVPESSQAYEVRPGGLRTIRQTQLVPGGTEVTLDDFSLSTLVLFTEDVRTLDAMKRRAQAIGPEVAQLHRELANDRLDTLLDVDRRMAGRPASAWQTNGYVRTARQHLQQCDGALARRDYREACIQAERALRPLRAMQRTNWEKAVHDLRSPIGSPATACFSTLPWHWHMVDQSRSWRLGPNLLAAGDFESLPAVQSAGWRHRQHATPGVEAQADVVPEALHAGGAGLRLRARLTDPKAPATLIETSPLWVVTPPVQVEAGSLVRIHGWVHVPLPLVGSVDGLVIFDSMTGLDLAERIGETTGWQQFTLYRVATQTGPLSITFALSGLGEVWLDDVSVQTLGR